MKRFVFILLILGLLACAQVLTFMATDASAARGVSNTTTLKTASLDFYYKLDEKARYLDLKNQWQSKHRGEFSPRQAVELADEAYKKASVEAPFEKWLYHGAPAPRVFTGKLHLYNSSKQALLDVPLKVTLRAEVGDLRVDSVVQLTDYGHLSKTARWMTLSEQTVSIPAVAPGEDLQVEVMRFRLMEFLAAHPNRWPSQLEVQVSGPQVGTVKKSLSLAPDHFVVPVLY